MARFYDIGGRKYVSATTFIGIIAKPALPFWYAKEERKRFLATLDELYEDNANRAEIRQILYDTAQGKFAANLELEKSSDFGNAIHTAIECFLRGDELPKLKKDEKVVFRRFLAWWKKAGLKPKHIEKTVWDDDLKIAGTMDLDAVRKRKRYVIDWKTGKSVWPENFLQNICYRYMAEKTLGVRFDGGILVHIPRDGSPVVEIPVPEGIGNMGDVKFALGLWRWNEKAGKFLNKRKYKEDEVKKPR